MFQLWVRELRGHRTDFGRTLPTSYTADGPSSTTVGYFTLAPRLKKELCDGRTWFCDGNDVGPRRDRQLRLRVQSRVRWPGKSALDSLLEDSPCRVNFSTIATPAKNDRRLRSKSVFHEDFCSSGYKATVRNRTSHQDLSLRH